MIRVLLKKIGERRAKRQALTRLGDKGEPGYASYVREQVGRTMQKINKDPSPRYNMMIQSLKRAGVGGGRGVLCVGCRNAYELDAFERAGFTDVRGIDLVSTDRRMLVMDMGEMEFPDNSFSVVYSGDSLEHAYDVEKAAAEFCRVVKNGGHIAVDMPANFRTNQIDRWDVKSVAGLSALLEPHVRKLEVVWQEELEGRIRAVFKVSK